MGMTIMKKLHGNKIHLRGFQQSDKEVVLAGANEPTGGKLTGTHSDGFTMAQIEVYIENNIKGDGRYAWIISNQEDVAVGEVVINNIDDDNLSANIRIALFDPQHYGKGYGTEAMTLAVDYIFENTELHRIELGVYAFNPRAIRVYEKIGFVKEGVLRDALRWEGEFYDEITMSILRPEWQNSKTTQ